MSFEEFYKNINNNLETFMGSIDFSEFTSLKKIIKVDLDNINNKIEVNYFKFKGEGIIRVDLHQFLAERYFYHYILEIFGIRLFANRIAHKTLLLHFNITLC